MIDLIIRAKGNELLYVRVGPLKGKNIAARRSPTGAMKYIGDIHVDFEEENSLETLLREIADLIENQKYAQ